MSNEDGGRSEPQASEGWEAQREAAERESIGQYLASQRRLRGISLDELASRTRIPRRNLERLEAGAFDAQPDGFVRGFVRTVALALGLDAQEAVMRLMGEPVVIEDDWRRRRRLGAAAGLALVGAAALLVLGLGLREAARWVARPDPDVAREHVYRRDAVRALAESRAAAATAAPEAEAATGPGGAAEAGPPGP